MTGKEGGRFKRFVNSGKWRSSKVSQGTSGSTPAGSTTIAELATAAVAMQSSQTPQATQTSGLKRAEQTPGRNTEGAKVDAPAPKHGKEGHRFGVKPFRSGKSAQARTQAESGTAPSSSQDLDSLGASLAATRVSQSLMPKRNESTINELGYPASEQIDIPQLLKASSDQDMVQAAAKARRALMQAVADARQPSLLGPLIDTYKVLAFKCKAEAEALRSTSKMLTISSIEWQSAFTKDASGRAARISGGLPLECVYVLAMDVLNRVYGVFNQRGYAFDMDDWKKIDGMIGSLTDAAGICDYLLEGAIEEALSYCSEPPPGELSFSVFGALRTFVLALAQTMFVRKQELSGTVSPAVLATYAIGAVSLSREANTQAMKCGSDLDQSVATTAWQLEKYNRARGQSFKAQADRAAERYSECNARMAIALTGLSAVGGFDPMWQRVTADELRVLTDRNESNRAEDAAFYGGALQVEDSRVPLDLKDGKVVAKPTKNALAGLP